MQDTLRMQSAKIRSRRRRFSSTLSEDSEDTQSVISLDFRPHTQDGIRSSYSRLSTDSGSGSLEDCNKRIPSPFQYIDGYQRRHTAPTRKHQTIEDIERPNTVHALDNTCNTMCSLSRYAPLPAIGARQSDTVRPARKQCFMEPLDSTSRELTDNNNIYEDTDCNAGIIQKPLFSLTLDSDSDSDFEEESSSIVYASDDEDRPKKPIARSATFTIETRPDLQEPSLLIAVRLPDDTRVSGRFRGQDTLGNVCEFAVQKMDCHIKRWSLVTTDVPKRVFKDLMMTLEKAGIEDKTLFHLQSRDAYDSD